MMAMVDFSKAFDTLHAIFLQFYKYIYIPTDVSLVQTRKSPLVIFNLICVYKQT